MLHMINGLPAHVLLIHVVVILVPLGALFTMLSAVWPAARRKLGFVSPLTCLVALLFIPITTSAGEWFKSRLHFSGAAEARLDKHADLAAGFVFYVLALFVVSAAVWWIGRRAEYAVLPARDHSEPTASPGGGGSVATATQTSTRTEANVLSQWQAIAIAVVAVVVAAIVTWQLYRIGDAGAQAVWHGSVSGG